MKPGSSKLLVTAALVCMSLLSYGAGINIPLAGNFTADATAHNQQRKDYTGGVENGSFFLKNCGFFLDFVNYDTTFSRVATGKQPVIDISSLP
jgi:hypothetical protein